MLKLILPSLDAFLDELRDKDYHGTVRVSELVSRQVVVTNILELAGNKIKLHVRVQCLFPAGPVWAFYEKVIFQGIEPDSESLGNLQKSLIKAGIEIREKITDSGFIVREGYYEQ